MPHDHIHDEHDHSEPAWLRHRRKPPVILMSLALIALTAWLGAKARTEWRQHDFVGVPIERNTITVSGEGKVVAVPDIAAVDVGAQTIRPTVADAQKENTRIMNGVIDAVKAAGVEGKDVQTTQYQISPHYEYSNGTAKFDGYQVDQTVHIKIRNLDKVSDIIGIAGSRGANQVGGIAFTVNDQEAVQAQAREKALVRAKEKAQALAKIAGVTLRRVVSFEENIGGQPTPYPYYAKLDAAASAVQAPSIEAGSSEFIVTVNVTYEIE